MIHCALPDKVLHHAARIGILQKEGLGVSCQ